MAMTLYQFTRTAVYVVTAVDLLSDYYYSLDVLTVTWRLAKSFLAKS